MTDTQKLKLIDAICNFKTAADNLNNVWAEVENDRAGETNTLLVKMYPFALSFDELVKEIEYWKNDVVEHLENIPTKTFIEFQATRQFYSVSEAIKLESLRHIIDDHDNDLRNRSGFFVYDKGSWIALCSDGSFWFPVSNYDVSVNTLAEAEERLYKEHYLFA